MKADKSKNTYLISTADCTKYVIQTEYAATQVPHLNPEKKNSNLKTCEIALK